MRRWRGRHLQWRFDLLEEHRSGVRQNADARNAEAVPEEQRRRERTSPGAAGRGRFGAASLRQVHQRERSALRGAHMQVPPAELREHLRG